MNKENAFELARRIRDHYFVSDTNFGDRYQIMVDSRANFSGTNTTMMEDDHFITMEPSLNDEIPHLHLPIIDSIVDKHTKEITLIRIIAIEGKPIIKIN